MGIEATNRVAVAAAWFDDWTALWVRMAKPPMATAPMAAATTRAKMESMFATPWD
jgi:hypothetical protein